MDKSERLNLVLVTRDSLLRDLDDEDRWLTLEEFGIEEFLRAAAEECPSPAILVVGTVSVRPTWPSGLSADILAAVSAGSLGR